MRLGGQEEIIREEGMRIPPSDEHEQFLVVLSKWVTGVSSLQAKGGAHNQRGLEKTGQTLMAGATTSASESIATPPKPPNPTSTGGIETRRATAQLRFTYRLVQLQPPKPPDPAAAETQAERVGMLTAEVLARRVVVQHSLISSSCDTEDGRRFSTTGSNP